MENVEIGLLLMVVGMTTVFAILLIVIFLGKGLIAWVNKFIPEYSPQTKTSSSVSKREEIPASVLAAIVSAIGMVTGGKGKVINVEKL